MNYISELNEFYRWLDENPLPADAQALWHALMHVNNMCAIKIGDNYYWPVEFKIANKELAEMLSVSRQQVDRMRKILVEKCRVKYHNGQGNQAGKYEMIPFGAQYVTQSVTQIAGFDAQYVTQSVTQVWGLRNILCTLINNKINSKDINNRLSKSACEVDASEGNSEGMKRYTRYLMKKYFGRKATDADIEIANNAVLVPEKGNGTLELVVSEERKELLEYALKKAALANSINWQYALAVLKNLQSMGVKTVDDAEELQAEFDLERS